MKNEYWSKKKYDLNLFHCKYCNIKSTMKKIKTVDKFYKNIMTSNGTFIFNKKTGDEYFICDKCKSRGGLL